MRILGASAQSIVLVTLAIVATSVTGARLTQIGRWYRLLRKPSWNPPVWVFPPAWSTIFLLLGLAVVMGLNAPASVGADRLALLCAFAANLVLNMGWSLLFFYRRRPDWALREVGFLWLSILVLMLVLRPLSVTASWLVAPYLAWVSFASVLNWRIVTLNEPFSQH